MTIKNATCCTSYRDMPIIKHSGNIALITGLAITIIMLVGVILAVTGQLPPGIPYDQTFYLGMLGGSIALTALGFALKMLSQEKGFLKSTNAKVLNARLSNSAVSMLNDETVKVLKEKGAFGVTNNPNWLEKDKHSVMFLHNDSAFVLPLESCQKVGPLPFTMQGQLYQIELSQEDVTNINNDHKYVSRMSSPKPWSK